MNMSTSSLDEGTKSARSAVHWSSCARLCTWSSAAFLGNGFTPFIFLNITDHTLLMILISGFFAGITRTSIAAPVRTSWLVFAVWGVVVQHETWGFHQYNSVQLGLCEYGAWHFREISTIVHVMYSHTQFSPTWNRKIKRLLCLVNNQSLIRQQIFLKFKIYAYQYFYFEPLYL